MLYVHVLFHTCTYNIFTIITQVPVQLDILFALNKKREGVYVSFLTTPTCNIINENTSTCVYIIQEVDLFVLFSSLRSQPISMKKTTIQNITIHRHVVRNLPNFTFQHGGRLSIFLVRLLLVTFVESRDRFKCQVRVYL